jgi:hypothetical protein
MSIIISEIAVIRFLAVAIALLFVQCRPAAAANQNCMNDYYRTKSPDCVDTILSQFRQAARSKSDPNTLIGFLAQLFSASAAEKQRLLDNEPSDYVRSVDLMALYRAGLPDDARKFADNNQLSALRQKLETNRPAPLAAVKPMSNPADNDLLIGAYMASGETALIQRILDNFSSADDGTVGDALRMGYMQSKFGPNLTPKGRESVMASAGCTKYQCKADPAKFLRVLTLASAFWALQSLSQQDDGIKKTLAAFFERDRRLKNLLAGEQAAFGNYVTALAMFAAFKPGETSPDGSQAYTAMSKAASSYENLEPASTVFSHIETLVKSGKRPN